MSKSHIQSIRLSSSSSNVRLRTKGGGLLGIGGRLRPSELERLTIAGKVRWVVPALKIRNVFILQGVPTSLEKVKKQCSDTQKLASETSYVSEKMYLDP